MPQIKQPTNVTLYKPDCRFFRGDIPCKPHKEKGVHCRDCPDFEKTTHTILIIKLGAIGDVIRTTPLISVYRKKYQGAKFTWLTLSPDILPKNQIDEILKFNTEAITYLSEAEFDIAINLDKEKEACALLKKVKAKEKFGYTLKQNLPSPINEQAEHKFLTGIFDDISKANTKSYCEEIFEICGLNYQGEPYLLDNHADKGYKWNEIDKSKKVIGLNTGCGDRWTTRLWPIDYFSELAKKLLDDGHEVILLGGVQEKERNEEIAFISGAKYLGTYPLQQFINQIDQCDLVVTQVTMGMHLTLGLRKKIVLMNNIFNPYEFDLFGQGEIIQPDKNCDCFYKGSCIHGQSCMHDLQPQKVYDSVNRVLTL